ncbi:protein-tyrosine phosphatase family protein [Streptomyces sp. Act143]|uniref:protein-tyrosine phosphatase family protein n=1 Tax=Streptomyces sp. Act143 TaxID=2200760 RepID=UPI0015E816C3|nr:protein-tyrosine phosphatase family protein [Streptomyces sp. Act143]
MGITTVVDLRAEDLSAAQLAEPGRAGLDVVRLPARDGQTPTPGQVRTFLDTVARASGPVFVRCGAGVGRTGTMAAAYLVQTG